MDIGPGPVPILGNPRSRGLDSSQNGQSVAMPIDRRLHTPLSFGLAKAALIAGVAGKFRLVPRGGIGLTNHLS